MITSQKIKDVLMTSLAVLSVASVAVTYDSYLNDREWKEMLLKQGYAEYDKKYPEYGNKYSVYDKKYEEYGKKYAE